MLFNKPRNAQEEKLLRAGYRKLFYINERSFDNAIVGVIGCRVVYDYGKMIDGLVEFGEMTEADAEDYLKEVIEPAIDVFGDTAPLIMHNISFE